eukprot:6212287-Pleurochrysis_carterae.AAC.2
MKERVAIVQHSVAKSTTMWASHPISALNLGGSAWDNHPSASCAVVVVISSKCTAVSIKTRVNVLHLNARRPRCHPRMNVQARASNYVVSTPSQLKTYHKSRTVGTRNR